jgi:hypothetical protein
VVDLETAVEKFWRWEVIHRETLRFAQWNRALWTDSQLSDQSSLNAMIYRNLLDPVPLDNGLVRVHPDVRLGISAVLHFNGPSRKMMKAYEPDVLIPIGGV